MADYQSSHSGPTIDERVTLAATNQADIAALKLRMSSAETSINNKADTSTMNSALATKQDKLVSGSNIKTVGGQNILGSGNIPVNDENAVKFVAQTLTDAQKEQARTNIDAASTEEVSQLQQEVTADVSQLEAKVDGLGEYENIPDFVRVYTDSEEKILWGIKADGTVLAAAGFEAHGDLTFDGENIKVIENPEFAYVRTDEAGRILYGVQTNGNFLFGLGVPKQIVEYIDRRISELSLDEYEDIVSFIGDLINDENLETLLNEKVDKVEGKSLIDAGFADTKSTMNAPEFLEATTDNDGKLLSSRNIEGVKKEYVGIETPSVSIDGTSLQNTEDIEGRMEIKTDAEGRILSYRGRDGMKYEKAGIFTEELELSSKGMTAFQQALRDSGFTPGGMGDWSEKSFIQIPIPTGLPIVNIVASALPTTRFDNYTAVIEFYDCSGNYFKKPIKSFATQGNSSQNYMRKNFKFDTADGSEWKFGHWVPQDSFHLKAFYIDVFVGIANMQYNWIEHLYRELGCRPSRNAFDDSVISESNSSGNLKQDFGTGAMCHPEGFPIELYVNGEYYGLYAFNMKKHRSNYLMDKKDYRSIMIDGWTNHPSMEDSFWKGAQYIPWSGSYCLELKNPKTLICMDGTEYDDEEPKELIDTTSPYWDASNKNMANTLKTKTVLNTMSNNWASLAAMLAEADELTGAAKEAKLLEAKEFMATFYDIDAAIFHFVLGQVIYNIEGMYGSNTQWMIYNGTIMAPTFYDLDSSFGRSGVGNYALASHRIAAEILPYTALETLYGDEIATFYSNARQKNLISVDAVMDFVNGYVTQVGYESYKKNIEIRNELGFDIPSYRSNLLNSEYWEIVSTPTANVYDNETTYQIGDLCRYLNIPTYFRCIKECTGQVPAELYDVQPREWGFYESPKRLEKWLTDHIQYLDNYFGYTN